MAGVPILSTLLEAWIKVGSNDALVQLGTSDVLHAVKCILVSVVLNETEPTWRLLIAIEAHHQSFDFPASFCCRKQSSQLGRWGPVAEKLTLQTARVFAPR